MLAMDLLNRCAYSRLSGRKTDWSAKILLDYVIVLLICQLLLTYAILSEEKPEGILFGGWKDKQFEVQLMRNIITCIGYSTAEGTMVGTTKSGF